MSEYWKSTPKYWCKHCKTFVKDTKFERTNHEATPKHQGNIKRFLRDLHKDHEREERDKQRAKDEVDRLNGVVPGTGSKSIGNPWDRKPAIPAPSGLKQATPTDRKKQLAQLAELGVAVPEDFRKEMAMAGDWQAVSQTPVYPTLKKEEESEDVKPQGLAMGVKKRKFEGKDEEEAGEFVTRRGWGSTTRTYPGTNEDVENDLDTLLNNTKTLRKIDSETAPEGSGSRDDPTGETRMDKDSSPPIVPGLKQEVSSITGIPDAIPLQENIAENTPIKQEDETIQPGILFKKRKSKPTRQT